MLSQVVFEVVNMCASEPTFIEIDMRNKPAQRKEIAALGGKFDRQRQRWYVPAGQSVAPFAKWLT